MQTLRLQVRWKYCYATSASTDALSRNDVLLPVLADSTALPACVATAHSMALPHQSYNRASCVDSHAYMGVRESTIVRRLLWAAHRAVRQQSFLGVAERPQCRSWDLLNARCEHSRFHCKRQMHRTLLSAV